jgi:hypothetical protein
LIRFLDVAAGEGGFGLNLADYAFGVVFAVIVDNPNGNLQPRGHGGAQQTGDGRPQQPAAIVGWDNNIKLHGCCLSLLIYVLSR